MFKKSNPSKEPSSVKKRRGIVPLEQGESFQKLNTFRDAVIRHAGTLNIIMAICLVASSVANAMMVVKPFPPSNLYVQYLSGKIAHIRYYNRMNLPPPQPLDIAPSQSLVQMHDDGNALNPSPSTLQAPASPAVSPFSNAEPATAPASAASQ